MIKQSLHDRNPNACAGTDQRDVIKEVRKMIRVMEHQLRPALRSTWFDVLDPNVIITMVQDAGTLKFGENIQDVVDFGTDTMWKSDIDKFFQQDSVGI